jgi:arylsulfatase A-like enzyme
VLLVVIDSLRADHMGYASDGESLTPWMDAFSEDAVRFTRAFSPNNATIESVASIFGGVPYSQLPGLPRIQGLPEETITIAEHLKAQGFITHAWSANFNVRANQGYAQGFDSFSYIMPVTKPDGSIDDVLRSIDHSYSKSNKNEFIYVHLQDVHHPYQPGYPWSEIDFEDYDRSVVRQGNMYTDFHDLVSGTGPYYDEHQSVEQVDKDYLYRLYKNAIRHVDDRLQELLDALDYDPKEDMLVLTSDHGEQFFEQDFWRHSVSLIAPEIHVPLIVRSPGLGAREVSQPVSLTNLFSTVTDLYELEEPNQATGTSLLPLMRGEDVAAEPVYCESIYLRRFGAAIIHEDWLYWLSISHYDSHPWATWPYQEYLFNLNDDVQCENNVAAAKPEIIARYNKLLIEPHERWQEFTSEAIANPGDQLKMGNNVLSSAPTPNATNTVTTISDSSSNTHKITSSAKSMNYAGTIDDAPLPHYFQFRYKLTSGQFILYLYNPETKTKYHHYLLRRPVDDWKTLQLIVPKPEDGPVALRITPVTDGSMEWQAPTLQSILVPDLRMVGHHESSLEEWESEFTADERARLETLGYISNQTN